MDKEKPNPPVTCSCGREADPCYEEVDIGVGVQRFLNGWECYEHGGICGTCNGCGVADRVGCTHRSWCPERARIVAWLRTFNSGGATALAIEQGEHLKCRPQEGGR